MLSIAPAAGVILLLVASLNVGTALAISLGILENL